ncbi:MAG TPA: hypothetical protein VHT50_03615 [Mycobacterium sp.]|jgi:hypothetical protein|nr:hypothetical protein [Mycobacterium sp.]
MRAPLAIAAIALSALVAGVPVAAAEPMSFTPPEVAPTDAAGMVFEDDPTIVKPLPTHIASWSRTTNPKAVIVHFMSGAPECHGVHATAKETDKTVTVNVDAGTPPAAVGKVCAMFAVFATVEVPLAAPLGDRKLLATY